MKILQVVTLMSPDAAYGGPVTVAVTLEPEGGAPQPTGPVVLLGS